jgi:hypothetical protein
MTTAARAAAPHALWRIGRSHPHETGSTGDNTAHLLSSVGMSGQSGLLHALFDLKAAWFLAFNLGDGFVDVSRHALKLEA